MRLNHRMTGILWAVVQSPVALQPRYPAGKPHHVTLMYGVERKDWEHLIGLPVTVGVLEECWNDRIQAISVVRPSWVPCYNPHPHISVSWVEDANPVESNAMLNGEHESALVDFEYVTCVIEFEEWGEVPAKPKTWKDNPLVQCRHEWKTGERKGQRCEVMTRRASGFCTKHIPKKEKIMSYPGNPTDNISRRSRPSS